MGFFRDRLRKMIEEELDAAIQTVKEKSRKIEIPVQLSVAQAPRVVVPSEEDRLTRGYYWSDSSSHWYFLREFQRPTSLERFDEGNQRDSMERSLKEPMISAVKSFIRAGLVEEVKMRSEDWLVFLYQKKELVGFCAELGVEASGTKDDLAALLWESDPDFVRCKVRVATHYVLTDAGLRAAAAQSKNKVLLERVRRMDEGDD